MAKRPRQQRILSYGEFRPTGGDDSISRRMQALAGLGETVAGVAEQFGRAKAEREAPEQAQQAVEQPVAQQQQVPQAVSDPKAEQWASDNDWLGKDNVMTAAALAIDAELKNEGYDPSDNDFYQEIDNRIKTSFPHKFEEDKERVQETTSSPAQVVSGSSRSSPSSRKKIKLSQEDLRLAQKWNIPLETYAAQKLKVHQADGDYTDIK